MLPTPRRFALVALTVATFGFPALALAPAAKSDPVPRLVAAPASVAR
jgi:hypothetical protein